MPIVAPNRGWSLWPVEVEGEARGLFGSRCISYTLRGLFILLNFVYSVCCKKAWRRGACRILLASWHPCVFHFHFMFHCYVFLSTFIYTLYPYFLAHYISKFKHHFVCLVAFCLVPLPSFFLPVVFVL